MGFPTTIPFDKAQASYVDPGPIGTGPGVFHVRVDGESLDYSYAISLERHPNFVGGLRIDVMGWRGPEGEGTKPYSVAGTFQGMHVPKIVVCGGGRCELIEVTHIVAGDADEHFRSTAPVEPALV